MIRKPANDLDRKYLRGLLSRQVRTRAEIGGYLTDFAALNEILPAEYRHDPDPDGALAEAAHYLDRTIAEIEAALKPEPNP